MNQIILASGSPRRKKLLHKFGFSFSVHKSTVDEYFEPEWSPRKVVRELARRKAKDVAGYYQNALIIGADTIVVFKDTILEKPDTPAEAKAMLQQLSGNTHRVLTGVALYKKIDTPDNSNIMESSTFVEQTHVIFGNLNGKIINSYVSSGNPMDKAGGYGIQDRHAPLFVKRIEGDYYNVVGFPLHSFYNRVNKFAPEFLSQQNLLSTDE